MGHNTETNCWRPAVWTLGVLVAIMALTAMFGGFEPTTVALQ
ncbi:MAG: hypothetical protein AAFX39_07750 [Pseudomonadota bacterium]